MNKLREKTEARKQLNGSFFFFACLAKYTYIYLSGFALFVRHSRIFHTSKLSLTLLFLANTYIVKRKSGIRPFLNLFAIILSFSSSPLLPPMMFFSSVRDT
ncbi:hypothetical protein DM02DRAFT_172191 [Periconia macrospinosa]|uniref:Uncharacterized protein n=1 Tax=Periconia macrospinosa TaxID=97972 RepID=A0A2V1DA28_9PLEO|nr:hypothetical protein DM02DRAFT_172191 [Periconia macrospinosa]